MSSANQLCAERVSFGYHGEEAIVSGLDLRIPPGRITSIVGPNGCGKSTLLRGLARLLAPRAGAVLLDGQSIHHQRTKDVARKIGLLPQAPVVPDGLTVEDLVARGRYPHQSLWNQWSRADEIAVERALKATQAIELRDRPVAELSGGQRQRVWIALALAQETPILLLDEPTTSLDIAHQLDILDLLARLNRTEGRTIVAVLHDINLAGRYAHHIIAMREGRAVSQGPPAEVITEQTMRAVFGIGCVVIADPVSGTPLCVPRSATASGGTIAVVTSSLASAALMHAAAMAITALAGAMLLIALRPPHVAEAQSFAGREINDMAGHPLKLSGAPKRAMIFPPVLSHYVIVDGDAHVMAIAKFMQEETAEILLGKLFPSLSSREEALTRVGALQLGVEQIMLETPDVVLAWAWAAAEFETIRYPGLARIKGDESPAMETTYRFLGDLTQQQKRVDALLARYREKKSALLGQIPRPARPTGVVVMNPWNYFLWGKYSPKFNNDVRSLGAVNAAETKDSFGDQMNIEELIGLDPEIIFLPAYASSQSNPEDIYSDPRLRAIRAVRDRRVYRFPNGGSRMDGPVENPLLMQWMAEIIYPDIALRVPMRTAIRDTYREIFAYEMSDEDIDAMLRLRENGISANYERFAREGRARD